jgi:hypothetical protein
MHKHHLNGKLTALEQVTLDYAVTVDGQQLHAFRQDELTG